MPSSRRSGALWGALIVLVLASCTDSSVVAPETAGDAPSNALIDGSTSGRQDFFFLPPIAPEHPTTVGEFNPDLAPAVRVCELDGEPDADPQCVAGDPVAYFPPGSARVSRDKYQLNWDTNGRETERLRTDRYYRLEVLVGGQVFGSVDLDPSRGKRGKASNKGGKRNSGSRGRGGHVPAERYVHSFTIGQTIPVKFFLSADLLCEGESFVTECTSASVVDQSGGNVTIEDEGNRLGVMVAPNSLPEGVDQITITLERLDPVAFFAETGQECVPGLDVQGVASGAFGAPQFGDCFRVRTTPELDDDLETDAVVSICLDPTDLDLTLQQIEQLRMVKFNDRTNNEWVALQETFGDCPAIEASLLDVPADGFLRYAALGVNALASAVLPASVEARSIRFGGFNSSFSRFRFALPGQMIPTDGDGAVIQPGGENTILATIRVLDAGDDDGLDRQPVSGARVRFEPADGSGTVSATEAVTDESGNATVEWTVDVSTPGEKVLDASSLGLVSGAIPDPDGALFEFVAESVVITATVVGAPASVEGNPDTSIDGAIAGEGQPLTVTVTDVGGNPVEGVSVAWTCSGDCSIPEESTTDGVGQSTVDWTPFGAGDQTAQAVVSGADGVVADFTAEVEPGAPASLGEMQSTSEAPVGTAVELTITVRDEFGNPIGGEEVEWMVLDGDGTFGPLDASTGVDGSALATFTVGPNPGLNRASVMSGGLSAEFVVDGTCASIGTPSAVDGALDEGWACAVRESFQGSTTSGSPVEGEVLWMNDGAKLWMAVRIRESSLTGSDVIIAFDANGNGVADIGEDAIAHAYGAFIDAKLSEPFPGEGDPRYVLDEFGQDGLSHAANDGEWTTIEIGHPFQGHHGEDIHREPGQPLGFFLTLSGEVYYPGLFEYRGIEIQAVPGH